ncbi:hypothetical protein HDU67_004200 [Dinochytrium kinnereticum]|nr:hypothetical protein HDU67_004200 [Dinochytrium kinnereticum]
MACFQPPHEGSVQISPALLDASAADLLPKYAAISYKFKPDSIDYSRPASLQATANNSWELEYASQEEGTHRFTADEVPGKDIECLLFYDPETNTYTLEPLDTTLRARALREKAGKPSKSGGNSTTASSLNSPEPTSQDIYEDEEEENEAEEEFPEAQDGYEGGEIQDEEFDAAFEQENHGGGGDVIDDTDFDGAFERELEEEIEALEDVHINSAHIDDALADLGEDVGGGGEYGGQDQAHLEEVHEDLNMDDGMFDVAIEEALEDSIAFQEVDGIEEIHASDCEYLGTRFSRLKA